MEKKKKKKAVVSQGRPTNVKVLILKSFSSFIPWGKPMNLLRQEGREITLQFRRSMKHDEVTDTIIHGFPTLQNMEGWSYLACDSDHRLSMSRNQKLYGNDVINRKGCLYITPTPKVNV